MNDTRSGPLPIRQATDENEWDCARLIEDLAAGPDESAEGYPQQRNEAGDDWEDAGATVRIFATPMQNGETLSAGTIVCYRFQPKRRRLEVVNGSC